MSGRRKYTPRHRRIRDALIAQATWGLTPCCRCHHPLEPGDQVQLDHADDCSDDDYSGLAHSSPCRVCGRRCNQAAGGELAARLAGKNLRSRSCVICGRNFTASRGTDGSLAVTCGQRDCVTAIRRIRRARQPDPDPPPQTGRAW